MVDEVCYARPDNVECSYPTMVCTRVPWPELQSSPPSVICDMFLVGGIRFFCLFLLGKGDESVLLGEGDASVSMKSVQHKPESRASTSLKSTGIGEL